MKKIISAACAAILAVSAFATTAFAEDFTMTAESVVAKPAIKVTLPKSMAFVFNPYGLTVDIKGKITTDSTGSDAIAACSYLFDTTTADKGWVITNNSGAKLKAAVYASSVNADDAKFVTVDKTDTEVLPAAADTKRGLRLEVKAGTATVFVHKAALTLAEGKTLFDYAATTAKLNGDGSSDSTKPATLIEEIAAGTTDAPGTLGIKMEGTIQNKGKMTWETTDVSKVNFVFAFDFAGGTTA